MLLLLLLRWWGLRSRGLRDGMRLRSLGWFVLRSLLLLLLGLKLSLGLGFDDLVGLGLVFLLRLGLLWHFLLLLGRALDPPALLVILLWLRLHVSVLLWLKHGIKYILTNKY